MVGKWNRDTSSVTATPSTVTSSSAAFGRWAFGIGQPRRDRRGRTGIVKGRSVRSAGNVLTTLLCSESGIFAICCDLTRPTTTAHQNTHLSPSTIHPLIAKRQSAGPLGVGRVVALDHALDGVPQPSVLGAREISPQEFRDRQIVLQFSQRLAELHLMK